MTYNCIIKLSLLFFFITSPGFVSSQYFDNYTAGLFFNRLPSARAEAMGQAYSSVDGDLSSMYFNPAGIATLKGIQINGSWSSPYYDFPTLSYNYLSIGAEIIEDRLSVGINRNNQRMVIENYDFGDSRGNYVPKSSDYALTAAYQISPSTYIGVTSHYFESEIAHYYLWDHENDQLRTVYFDLGVIKKVKLFKESAFHHSAAIGSSIINLNLSSLNGSVKIDEASGYGIALPSIARVGINYQLEKKKLDGLNPIRFLLQAEYQDAINATHKSFTKIGSELLIKEIIAIRCGHYSQTEVFKKVINQFTYGIGLSVPFNAFTDLPLSISLDYTSLQQIEYRNYTVFDDGPENFDTYTVNLIWKPNKKHESRH